VAEARIVVKGACLRGGINQIKIKIKISSQFTLSGSQGETDPSSTFKLEAGFLEQTLQRRGGRIWEHNHTLVLYLSSKAPLGSAQP
jgi:hypothetical protein